MIDEILKYNKEFVEKRSMNNIRQANIQTRKSQSSLVWIQD